MHLVLSSSFNVKDPEHRYPVLKSTLTTAWNLASIKIEISTGDRTDRRSWFLGIRFGQSCHWLAITSVLYQVRHKFLSDSRSRGYVKRRYDVCNDVRSLQDLGHDVF